MLWEKTIMFWKAGLAEKNRRVQLLAMISLIVLVMSGCREESPNVSNVNETVVDIISPLDESDYANAEDIAVTFRDIYDDAVDTNSLRTLEVTQCIISRLGENGYIAVDSQNQVDMAGAGRVVEFCKAVDERKNDKISIIVIMGLGFRKFDLMAENGSVNVVRGYYQYDKA